MEARQFHGQRRLLLSQQRVSLHLHHRHQPLLDITALVYPSPQQSTKALYAIIHHCWLYHPLFDVRRNGS